MNRVKCLGSSQVPGQRKLGLATAGMQAASLIWCARDSQVRDLRHGMVLPSYMDGDSKSQVQVLAVRPANQHCSSLTTAVSGMRCWSEDIGI